MTFPKKKYQKYTDEQLMKLLQCGNTSAFDELFCRYSRHLLFFFFRMLGGNEQKAQDFLQDTFLKIVEKPDLFNPAKKFSTWIFTMAYNLCKNEYRRLEIRKIIEKDVDIDTISKDFSGDYHSVEQNVDHQIFESALFTELEKCDEDHRIAFLMRYQQNFSIKEISEIFECPEGTIKSRLFYTTQKLARKLKVFNPYEVEVS